MIYLATSDRLHFRQLEEQRQLGLYLLRQGLWRTAGLALDPTSLRRTSRGKPYLEQPPGIQFNISHCAGGAAVAIASRRTGIDIERVRPYAPAAAYKALAPEELEAMLAAPDPDRAFFRFWTLKESYLKALGIGLSLPLKQIRFEIGPGLAIASNRRNCQFRLIENRQGFIAAVCRIETAVASGLAEDAAILWELP